MNQTSDSGHIKCLRRELRCVDEAIWDATQVLVGIEDVVFQNKEEAQQHSLSDTFDAWRLRLRMIYKTLPCQLLQEGKLNCEVENCCCCFRDH